LKNCAVEKAGVDRMSESRLNAVANLEYAHAAWWDEDAPVVTFDVHRALSCGATEGCEGPSV